MICGCCKLKMSAHHWCGPCAESGSILMILLLLYSVTMTGLATWLALMHR